MVREGGKMRFVRDNVVTKPKNEDSSLAVFLELEYYPVLFCEAQARVRQGQARDGP